MSELYPLLFDPVYKDYLWGGDRIPRKYGRDVPPGVYAESWELSAHPEGMSRVANGPWRGRPLEDLASEYGAALLGTRVGAGPFPLLVKLIDSKDRLSVQVHPNDETAARYGGEAKTEMWYMLDADPGAGVFAGLGEGVDEAAFRRAIEETCFEDVLVRVPVEAGDAVFIPGGRVHAIDRGCLILEVQQSSNTTYRIHDWGRVGADGKPRELHIEEAVRVTSWNDPEPAKVEPEDLGSGRWLVHESTYFRMERWEVDGVNALADSPETFQALFCAGGDFRIGAGDEEVVLNAGATCLLPACLEGVRIAGRGEALRITVP